MTRLRWLDFDIENRPISYLGSDFTTSDITVIAWGWIGEESEIECYYQSKRVSSRVRMLRKFVEAYDQADGVTGHYILGHDLPIISGHLLELGLPPLGPKLVLDTKIHLVNRKGVSASQESLGGMLGLTHQKIPMDQTKWRSANRLEASGIPEATKRCIGDVLEHMEMFARLRDLGWLKPPTVYRGGGKEGPYTP
jgi:hypothetical protein